MPLTIGQIEDLLLARVALGLPYLATVESYQGQIKEDIQQVIIRTPAVLALLQDTLGAPLSCGEIELTHNFKLIVVCRNLRGREAARREEGGAYQILGDLRRALADYVLAKELQPLAFEKDEVFFITNEWAIYFSTYTVKQEIETDE